MEHVVLLLAFRIIHPIIIIQHTADQEQQHVHRITKVAVTTIAAEEPTIVRQEAVIRHHREIQIIAAGQLIPDQITHVHPDLVHTKEAVLREQQTIVTITHVVHRVATLLLLIREAVALQEVILHLRQEVVVLREVTLHLHQEVAALRVRQIQDRTVVVEAAVADNYFFVTK